MSAPKVGLAVSRRARREIASIRAYTVANWGEAQADAYGRQLIDAFESLQMFPMLGPTCGQFGRAFRCLTVGQHRIIYNISEETVRVYRVVHARQAPMRISRETFDS